MALKEIRVTINNGGEDDGRVFVITRMNAFAADKWARHLVQALTRAGVKLPDGAMQAGLAGLAGMAQTLFGHLEEDATERAFSALLDCVKVVPDPAHPATVRAIIEGDFQHPETLPTVRAEAFKLHVGFLKAATYQLSPIVAALLPADAPPTA